MSAKGDNYEGPGPSAPTKGTHRRRHDSPRPGRKPPSQPGGDATSSGATGSGRKQQKRTEGSNRRNASDLTGSNTPAAESDQIIRRTGNNNNQVTNVTRGVPPVPLPTRNRSPRRNNDSSHDPPTCPYWQPRSTEPQGQGKPQRRTSRARRTSRGRRTSRDKDSSDEPSSMQRSQSGLRRSLSRSLSRTRQSASQKDQDCKEVDYDKTAVDIGTGGSFFKTKFESKRVNFQFRVDDIKHGAWKDKKDKCVVHFAITVAINRGDAKINDAEFEVHFRSSTGKQRLDLVDYSHLERLGESIEVNHEREKNISTAAMIGQNIANFEQRGEYRRNVKWTVVEQYRLDTNHARDHLTARLVRLGKTGTIYPPTKFSLHVAVLCPRGDGIDIAGKVRILKEDKREAIDEWRRVDLDVVRPPKTNYSKLLECVEGVEDRKKMLCEVCEIVDKQLGPEHPTTKWCKDTLAECIKAEASKRAAENDEE
ncbi:hypothetical protein FDECE_9788 [Fusarium decemcellulare]|nr:hypothetical protein FDECE_9788 [Fusarium decemcellulare]